jgi:L-threonylcarbamoyladenylate synthase
MAQISTNIMAAATHLMQGDVVAIPTETVYGLAGNALNEQAVLRIFQVKQRPSFDPLIVHIHDVGEVEKYALFFPPRLALLAQTFWPGPLTLLLPKKGIIPDLVTSGLDRVALRVPAHPLAMALLKVLPFPLAAPSANPFGYISPTSAAHVQAQLGEQIPYILDGGGCEIGLESTIVGQEGEDIVVYRLGGISPEAIRSIIGPIRIMLNESSNPSAPGMLKSHYAPRVPLVLRTIEEMYRAAKTGRTGAITFKQEPSIPGVELQIHLSAEGDVMEAARNLFAALRLMDTSGVEFILAEPAPNEGIGQAINDRLRRAAAEK